MQDTLVVESVAHVAWQGCHRVAIAKVRHADRAAFDIWETIFIIGYFRSVADDTFSVDLLFVFLSPSDDTIVADAGRENNDHGCSTQYNKGLRQDKADHDTENE